MSTIVNNQSFAEALLNNSPQSTISGTTTGSIIATMPDQGQSDKRAIIYCDALDGDATYTFPTPFTYIPDVVVSSSLVLFSVASVTTTAITVSTTSPQTGFVLVQGF